MEVVVAIVICDASDGKPESQNGKKETSALFMCG